MDDRDDDRYWKFGVFYVNPRNPRLVVPKRYVPGRTLNYGHPVAWIWTFLVPVVIGLLASYRRGF